MSECDLLKLIATSSDQETSRETFLQKYGSSSWVAPASEEWYYSKTKRPVDTFSTLKTVFLHPFLEHIRIRSTPEDPSYGRYALPFSPLEQSIRNDPKYTCWDERIFLKNRGDGVSEPVETKTSEWIWYQVWWDEQASKRAGLEVDFLYCHGLGEYGGTFAKHARKFLDAGYRVILLDLPSHGRSTGFHAHITKFDSLAHAVHIVLADTTKRDLAAGRTQRRVVVGGQSLGGFTTVLYGLLYHSNPRKSRPKVEGLTLANLIGLIPVCPMLAISPDSRPIFLVELLARMIDFFAGRLALADANKGKNTRDHWAEEQFKADPQCYPGNLRVSTGLGILTAVDYVDQNMSELLPPFRVLHGGGDRVTNPKGSIKLFQSAKSTKKSIKIYPLIEHIILRIGRDEEDDQPRQQALNDMIEWINQIKDNP